MVGDMNQRYELDRLGEAATLYIQDGIPELEDGAPFWLYNDLRDLMHEANRCNGVEAVKALIAKIRGRGYGVRKIKLLKKARPTARWLGRQKVVNK